ncbi:MAG: type II secretion system protein GspG [Kiritimatiellae bacterium]|nr:type II secretion system protein GspG [Kiritimatiellia bacterium]
MNGDSGDGKREKKKLKPIVNSKGLTRKERQAKIRQISREFEKKKAMLGPKPLTLAKGPAFYLATVAVLAVLGGAIVQSVGDGGKNAKTLIDRETAQAKRSLEAVAEAMGRFKYHCGTWPTIAEGGIAALAEKNGHHPGWMGPYIHIGVAGNPARWKEVAFDPWKRPYVYEPPADDDAEGVPVVLSLGRDGIRGTADDIAPDPALFTKALRDTAWAEDWAPFYKRGLIVVPKAVKEAEKRAQEAQRNAKEAVE